MSIHRYFTFSTIGIPQNSLTSVRSMYLRRATFGTIILPSTSSSSSSLSRDPSVASSLLYLVISSHFKSFK